MACSGIRFGVCRAASKRAFAQTDMVVDGVSVVLFFLLDLAARVTYFT